ncbi:MAG: glutamine--fructose-6-phosphate transaminase (isomerizing) [Tenericutes bacterium]|nr:glutamine--fructose-6-phosphate transaminase (isomerizing) [Mycoplasmatota bacterium]
MCGIVGYVGNKENCVRVLIDGLEKLEYRGYDSAGIAFLNNDNIDVVKEKGKIVNLKSKIDLNINSNLGIGHTRWATHGNATKENAHPHKVGAITVVHNGIVENYNELKKDLINKGYVFNSETDTEVVAALIDYIYKKEKDMLKTIQKVKELLTGSYALGIICDDNLDTLYTLKNKSPLIIGVNENENYIASDVPAILDKTRNYIVLEDKDYASIKSDGVKIYHDGKEKDFEVKEFLYDANSVDKQGYEHFMLKEMNEQPEVFKNTTTPYLKNGIDSLIEKMPDFTKYERIRIVACGSATHAGLVGKCMIEKYANVEVMVETASEFRYKKQFLKNDELVIVVSQSGETADTLEALLIAKQNGNDTLGIVNAKGSTIARESKMVLYTEAGQEIAVATTKAYSAQVALLSLIALNLSCKKNLIDKKEMLDILRDVKKLPDYIEELLNRRDEYKKIAEEIKDYNDVFFIGRGVDYALAQEGSLKLKEISYTHSEAYAAGELKHGTISLIEDKTPVIAVITDDDIALKTISNVKEVKSRGANVICITNKNLSNDSNLYDKKIVIPKVNDLFEPLLTVIPLQMIAYELAKLKECSIDKPRNLAKSVTVE